MQVSHCAVLTLKDHIAQVKDSSEQFADLPGVVLSEHEDLQSWTEVGIFLHVITSFTAGALTLVTWSKGLHLNGNSYLDICDSPHSKSITNTVFYLNFTVCSVIILVPWSDSCTQKRSQEKESFSAQLACPSACSKRRGSFFPQAPAHESTCSLPQENVSCTMLLLFELTNLPTWRQTLDFSSRYCSMRAPSMAPPLVKLMSMYFPKRLELSLRMVLALPKAVKKTTKHNKALYYDL